MTRVDAEAFLASDIEELRAELKRFEGFILKMLDRIVELERAESERQVRPMSRMEEGPDPEDLAEEEAIRMRPWSRPGAE